VSYKAGPCRFPSRHPAGAPPTTGRRGAESVAATFAWALEQTPCRRGPAAGDSGHMNSTTSAPGALTSGVLDSCLARAVGQCGLSTWFLRVFWGGAGLLDAADLPAEACGDAVAILTPLQISPSDLR